MVTPEELHNDDDYADILEDIKEECSKYGEIVGVRIPRPTAKSKKWLPSDTAVVTAAKNQQADQEAGVGRVYVKFADLDATAKAIKALGGRQFAGRTILVANVKDVSCQLTLRDFADNYQEEFLGPAPPPPPPEDLDAAADAAVADIMGSLAE
jgi:splicing factor U2AF subunit